MGMNTSKQRGALSEINVTPLVDVMLVLLIVFMVTTPIIVNEISQQKVEIDMPATSAEPVEPGEIQNLIVLRKNRTVNLDTGQGETELASCEGHTGDTYDGCLGGLADKVRPIEKLKEERIFIVADRGLPYGFVVDVMARLKKGGILNVGMVTNPAQHPDMVSSQ